MGAKEKNIKKVLYFWLIFNTIEYIGAWRSLVARTAGGREVAGSNPVAPTFYFCERLLQMTLHI